MIPKILEKLLEIAETYQQYNRMVIKKIGIPIMSEYFVFEDQLKGFDKEVLDKLEKAGFIRRNKYDKSIIEIADIYSVYKTIILSQIKNIEKKIDISVKIESLSEIAKYVEPRIKNVQGLDVVKKIMVLQLFSEKDTHMRNRIHILLLGEPGTGKSVLLQWQANVDGLYRSLRITKAGLSGSVRLNDFMSGDPLLKKANNKILCLDEIDKISNEDLDPLLSAMEEGIVTLSGATMDTVYDAKIRVFAASNRDNFRTELLDRFDYIKRLRRLTNKEIQSVIKHLINEISDEEPRTLMSIEFFKRLIKLRRDFHPKLVRKDLITSYILDAIEKDPKVDGVRHAQKWIRFALAYAKLKGTDVTADLIIELRNEINNKK